MEDTPVVTYIGPDAESVARQWHADDRPFDLAGVSEAESVSPLEAERNVGCVVVDGVDDPLSLVDRIREEYDRLPIVLVDADDVDAAEAVARGVTHYVDDVDRIPLLESLASVLERYRRERRERTMLDSLLENIPLSVYFKDDASRYVRVSDAMLSMTGTDYIENSEGKRFHTPADVAGASEYDLFPAEPAETALADDRTVIEEEESIDNKVEHVYGSVFDGTFVATSKAPWYDERGDVVGLVGVTRDISERTHYEHRLERQNERLQRFAGVISHDLRNPLEVARGRVELAREECESEHLADVDRSLQRMDDLVDDVLTLARHGEAVTDPEPVSLATVARDAWNVVESGDADLAVETDATVEADPGRLRQVFENLFRNAVEHAVDGRNGTEAGDGPGEPGGGDRSDAASDGLTVTVDDIHGDLGFVVADDGRGIPAGEREAIFEAGYTTDEDGTGLGLNIVQTIADAHGWNVAVTDTEAGGAAFRFEDPHLDEE